MSQTWLGGPIGFAIDTSDGPNNVCWRDVWDNDRAAFRPCALPVIAALPAALATLLLVFQVLNLLLRWRPNWTRPFVVEYVELTTDDTLKAKSKRSPLSVLLLLLVAAGFFVTLVDVVETWPALESLLALVTWFVALGMLAIYPSSTPSYTVLAILSFLFLTKSIVLTSLYRTLSSNSLALRASSLVLAISSIFVLLSMPLRDPDLPSTDISQPFTQPTAKLRSPEDQLTLWQFMTVRWMAPMIALGYKQQLDDDNVWQLPYEFQHRRLHENFRQLKGTVIQRLVAANIIDLCIILLLTAIGAVTYFANPVLLQQLLAAMQDPLKPKRVAVIYASLTLAFGLVSTQSAVLGLWFGRRCYERSRGEMITMLYEKTLGRKIAFEEPASEEEKDGSKTDITNGAPNGVSHGNGTPETADKPQIPFWRRAIGRVTAIFGSWKKPDAHKAPASMGKILNLMRNDVYEVAQRFWDCQDLLRVPISAILSVSLLIRFLGWPALFSVGLLILTQISSAIIARIMAYYVRQRRVATDSKLQYISQFVEAVRHLRWYGWQDQWLKQIMDAREEELRIRIILNVCHVVLMLTQSLSLDLCPVVAFFAYTVIGKRPLTVDIAFPAMQLFSMVNQSLQEIPDLITTLIDAWVAVGRIEDFMAEADREEMATEALIGDSVAVEHGSFAWPGLAVTVLKDVNLSFSPGLHVIFGEVASGKTALLQALLGELDMLEGQLFRPQVPVAYCAQTPWLQSMSIRDNILFSAPYEEIRYKQVLAACALTTDLAHFKAGDETMIGENGIGLSGGQKARVALARAVYSRTSILLLDDPLSALDQETAEAIAKNCLAGPLMEGRVTVIVTHRTDLVLDYATQFIRMEDGTATIVEKDALAQDNLHRTVSAPPKGTAEDPSEDEKKDDVVADKFEDDEHREAGGVKFGVYWTYIKAGKIRWWSLLVLAAVLYRLDSVASAYVLRAWGEAYNKTTEFLALAMQAYDTHTVNTPSWPFDRFPSPDVDVKPWLLLFSIFAVGETIAYGLLRIILVIVMFVAARRLFKDMMHKVAYATFRYYDVTPLGRLMNRMTSDIGVLDAGLPNQLRLMVQLGISWVTALAVIASVTPIFLLFSAVLVVSFVTIFLRFLPTSQSLRRLEMVSLTPLMSNFGALLNGLATVRAFRAQSRFQDRVIAVVDKFQKMDHFYWSLQAWLLYRFEVLSDVSTFIITMLALATNLSPGWTAFALLYSQKFVGSTHALCRHYGQLQMEFVSVERAVELLHVEQEPQGTVTPPAWWPSYAGDIVFEDVVIKYAPHLDPALDGISFTVKGGSKTAIIGRTGSGKSTLALAMLATLLPSQGSITVDNINLADVDKQLLRTRVTFLAQDPVLFPGSMRQNLDPVGEHTDEACLKVLTRVCERQGWSLETVIEAGGKNISQGQRQLVGLARAVLRRSAIIILDEATASIDRETAMQMQQVMHEEMKESTVITIAHRLEAVKNADYCIVLGKGKILRQGPAEEMLKGRQEEMVDEDVGN